MLSATTPTSDYSEQVCLLYENNALQSIQQHDLLSFYQKRIPNGLWDDDIMRMDIFMFQANFMNTEKKQGVCDRDTINALINNDNYNGSGGWYDSTDLIWSGRRYYGL